MTAGLLILASTWKKKYFMITKPIITFFRYVTSLTKFYNFAMFKNSLKFNTQVDFGKKVTCDLDKNGDLIHKIFLVIEIPSIPKFKENSFTYSKNFISYWWLNDDHINKVAWVEHIGYNIIKNVEIEIGSKIIDKMWGELLYVLNKISSNNWQKKGLDKMIGNTDELINFTNGKNGDILYVPLNFWFCKHYELALPLIALKNSEIKIHVEFNWLENCLIYGPSHYIKIKEWICIFKFGEMIFQKQNNNYIFAKFFAFDDKNKIMFYLKLHNNNNFIVPNTDDDYQILYKIKNLDNENVTPQNNAVEYTYITDFTFSNLSN